MAGAGGHWQHEALEHFESATAAALAVVRVDVRLTHAAETSAAAS
jgi:hypothetical protein